MSASSMLKKGMLQRAFFDAGAVIVGGSAAFLAIGLALNAAGFGFAKSAFFVALFAMIGVGINHVLGLYSTVRTYDFKSKAGRIFVANGLLLLIVLATFTFAGLTTSIFYAGLLGCGIAAAVQTAARYSAEIVRREKVAEFASRMADASRGNDNKKVLVIGGAGYIGSAVVPKLLERGFKVRVLDILGFGQKPIAAFANHPNCEIIHADFRNIEDLVRGIHGVGTVVHLGGLVGDPACAFDEELTVDINVTATKIIGQIAKAQGVERFVFASSCSVYGANDFVVDESSVFNPQSLYARTKVAGEAVLREMADASFAPTFLRFATIYGVSGRTRFDLVVNLLTAKAIKDKKITVFGSDQWRPFVHVDDIASAIVKVIEAPREVVDCEAFNVGSNEQNYTLGDLATIIKSKYPDAEIVTDDTFVDRRNYRVNFDKLHNALDFKPNWTLEMGIRQMGDLVKQDLNIDYNDPSYSNVKFLQSTGKQLFDETSLSGWEENYMNISTLSPGQAVNANAKPKAS